MHLSLPKLSHILIAYLYENHFKDDITVTLLLNLIKSKYCDIYTYTYIYTYTCYALYVYKSGAGTSKTHML